jgi:hypothetical protein
MTCVPRRAGGRGRHSFVTAVLRQEGAANPGPAGGAWHAYRSDPELVTRLASIVAARAKRNHLVAALTADPLSQQGSIGDPSTAGFDSKALPSSVGEALAKYLDQRPSRSERGCGGCLPPSPTPGLPASTTTCGSSSPARPITRPLGSIWRCYAAGPCQTTFSKHPLWMVYE